jgi:prepilin-type N-terminal cleavage/methylation domain-containing protein
VAKFEDQRMARSRASGFTLIEILAVMAILILLISLATPMITSAQEKGRVVACTQNARNIAVSMKSYVDLRKEGKWPKEASGIKFLLILYKAKEVEGHNAKVFLCPGTQDENHGGKDYDDWDNIDPNSISYAGRDTVNHPIQPNDLVKMAIVSDDNQNRANHKHQTVVGYADGHTQVFDIDDYLSEIGELKYIPVGPESPVPDLKDLSAE